jgi:hypothetical protein
MNCPKCNTEMTDGLAIENTWVGKPDFIGDTRCVTMSPGGPGKLIECVKCHECGFSLTKGA